MAKTYPLNVELREERGTRAAARLRRSGFIPVMLYGRGQDNVALKLAKADLDKATHSGANVFELLRAGQTDHALIQDVQLDPLGDDVLHVDFIRISLTERVRVTVPIELHGTPKGAAEGGIVHHMLHDVDVECLPTDIPERIRVEIADLAIDDEIKAKDLKTPEGVAVLTPPEEVVVSILPPAAEEVVEAAAPVEGVVTAEPEVIGRKPEEEAAEEEAPAKGKEKEKEKEK